MRDNSRCYPANFFAKSINGRLYFPWRGIEAWPMAQPDAA